MTKPRVQKYLSIRWMMYSSVLLVLGLSWFWMRLAQPTARPTTVVQLTRDLPAYAVLTSADLIETTVATPPKQPVTSITDVTGSVTLAPLASGSILTIPEQIKLPPDSFVLTAPISTTLVPRPGETMILLGSTNDFDKAQIVSRQAITLGVQEQQVVLGLPSSEAQDAAAYLTAGRRLYLARSTP